MGKILITGALGNVGGFVAKYSLLNHQEIKLADINEDALKEKYGEGQEVVYFDFTDPMTFSEALEGVDRVFLMRPPHLGKPEDLKPFIEALQKIQSIRLVCFLSLIGIEKNPIPPHYKIEKYLVKAGLKYCFIRPSFFMQNLTGIHAAEIKHFNRVIVPVRDALTSFIDTEDVGELIGKVFSEAHLHENSAYSITGGEALSYWQVSEILSEALGREILYTNPKPSFAKNYWINVRGIDKKFASVMGMLYMMTRFGTAKRTTPTFEQVMGKKPETFRGFVNKNRGTWS